MPESQTAMPWEKESLAKFNKMIERMPVFHRQIAHDVVRKQAEINAKERSASQVEEGDIVRAFFSEVPAAFYSMMIRLLGDVGFDYKKYEAN